MIPFEQIVVNEGPNPFEQIRRAAAAPFILFFTSATVLNFKNLLSSGGHQGAYRAFSTKQKHVWKIFVSSFFRNALYH